jgi:hypothetical protein
MLTGSSRELHRHVTEVWCIKLGLFWMALSSAAVMIYGNGMPIQSVSTRIRPVNILQPSRQSCVPKLWYAPIISRGTIYSLRVPVYATPFSSFDGLLTSTAQRLGSSHPMMS